MIDIGLHNKKEKKMLMRNWLERLTYEEVSSAEQEVCGEEGDPVEGERQQPTRSTPQVKDQHQHAAQAEVGGPAVHDDPVMALCGKRQEVYLQEQLK